VPASARSAGVTSRSDRAVPASARVAADRRTLAG
jgi:hypothetical protein